MRGNRIESDQWRLIVRARHNSDSSVPAYQYELPDCSVIELTTERHRIPETLFDPSQLQRKPTDAEEIKPIQQMIFDSISVCDVDVRKELFNSINVSGGSTLFPKFVERLNREVSLLAPQQVRFRAASEEIALFIHSLIHSLVDLTVSRKSRSSHRHKQSSASMRFGSVAVSWVRLARSKRCGCPSRNTRSVASRWSSASARKHESKQQ